MFTLAVGPTFETLVAWPSNILAVTDLPSPATPLAVATVAVGAVISLVGVLATFVFGRRFTDAIGVAGMTRIALLAVLHFAVSFSAKLFNTVLSTLLGPGAIFVSEIGGEVFPSLIQALTVAIIRRPGALALSNLTVSLLNGLCAGQLGPLDLWLAIVGATLGELCLLATGATRLTSSPNPVNPVHPVQKTYVWPARCALAIALYNGGMFAIQYSVFQVLFSLFLSPVYIASVIVVVGFLYGGIGGLLGARWGVRLRELA